MRTRSFEVKWLEEMRRANDHVNVTRFSRLPVLSKSVTWLDSSPKWQPSIPPALVSFPPTPNRPNQTTVAVAPPLLAVVAQLQSAATETGIGAVTDAAAMSKGAVGTMNARTNEGGGAQTMMITDDLLLLRRPRNRRRRGGRKTACIRLG